MNYADIKIADVANGKGVRVSLFVSGCNHHCKGCFNAQAWDFNYGKEFTEKEIDKILEDLDHPYVSGLSLLGGEPLEYSNQKGLLPLVKKVKEKFPDKKRPAICITKGNFCTVYGYFKNEIEADLFIEELGILIGAKQE